MFSSGNHDDIETLHGSITSVGFSSGHRFVIGHWPDSPIGPFADIMWRGADDSKTLVAASAAAEYVTGIYPFDDLVDAPVTVTDTTSRSGGNRFVVESEPLTLTLTVGRLVLPLPPRPRWVTSSIERWAANTLLGVNTHGVSPTGVEEWYRTKSVRRVVDGKASLRGTDLGSLVDLDQPMEVGFSEPPRRPTHVRLRVDVRRGR